MLTTILIIAVRTAITILFGIAIGDRLSNQYRPQLYTLIIEHHQPDFGESTYDTRKFISAQERSDYIDHCVQDLMHKGYEPSGHAWTDSQESIYIVFHEID